jgi:hypothetical protein
MSVLCEWQLDCFHNFSQFSLGVQTSVLQFENSRSCSLFWGNSEVIWIYWHAICSTFRGSRQILILTCYELQWILLIRLFIILYLSTLIYQSWFARVGLCVQCYNPTYKKIKYLLNFRTWILSGIFWFILSSYLAIHSSLTQSITTSFSFKHTYLFDNALTHFFRRIHSITY